MYQKAFECVSKSQMYCEELKRCHLDQGEVNATCKGNVNNVELKSRVLYHVYLITHILPYPYFDTQFSKYKILTSFEVAGIEIN